MAGWTGEQQLCQLKALLDKTALQVFRMLSPEEKSEYSKAVGALRKRFKPVAIEELRGMEFHQLMQDSQSIEQLGIELQRLARKAFPGIMGREQDILLKGRFFQALLPRWQRKLVPKPEETFSELYDRARTLEKHEKQYVASAAVRADSTTKNDKKHVSNNGKQRHSQRVPIDNVATNSKSSENQNKMSSQTSNKSNPSLVSNSESSSMPSQRRQVAAVNGGSHQQNICFHCDGTGHYHSSRERSNTKSQREAPGRSNVRINTSRSAAVTVDDQAGQLTEQQLEQMLAKLRLDKEKSLLQKESAKVDTISAEGSTEAVGPTLYLDLFIEGVPVEAMVDSGSQSTIISREVLHKVGRHLKTQGKQLPQLTIPSARLYGKDGKKNQREINISAEVLLTIEADGKQVQTPVFIQPDGDQPCLLGMNAAPSLNLQFLRANGQPLKSSGGIPQCKPRVTKVCLIESATIPARKGRFLEATFDENNIHKGDQLLFEPKLQTLQAKGFSAQEALLTVTPTGKILVPLLNMELNSSELEAGDEIGTVELISFPSPHCSLGDTNLGSA